MQMEPIEPQNEEQNSEVKNVLKDLLQRMSQSLDTPQSVIKPKKQLTSSLSREELKHLINVPEEVHQKWDQFKHTYSKVYKSVRDELTRFAVFVRNLFIIEQHNARFAAGKTSFEIGINQFTDMTADEVSRQQNGFRLTDQVRHRFVMSASRSEAAAARVSAWVRANGLPAAVDWRTKGWVTPVKNQEECGSCWAFSTTGSMEGQEMNRTKKLVSLSEQQLVDCSDAFGNQGCSGGLMDQAFDYIKKYGIESEAAYPYYGKDRKCQYNKSKEVVNDTGHVDVTQGSESALQEALAAVGPVSIAIDASVYSFHSYKGGVYYEPECSSTELDHGVLVVGYGTDAEKGLDYWIVKNSWGAAWGESGYIRMARNKDNNCGVATAASYPIVP